MRPRRDFTETALIQWIRKTTAKPSRHPLGIGDDCAILQSPESGRYVLTTDMLLEGVHFERGTPPYRTGWKAAARSLSDVAAMGCPATAFTACVVFTRGTEPPFARALFRGLRGLAALFDVPLVGGDISSWDGPLALNVTAIGEVGSRDPIRRSGAQVGDSVFVSGRLGGSILRHHLHFRPRLDLGCALSGQFRLSAMIDISDGLARDLGHILEESGVGAKLVARRIPVSPDARRLAATSGSTALEHALYDGEDYELLFTAPSTQAQAILNARLPAKVSLIGEITPEGVVLEGLDGQTSPIPCRGYEHRL